MEAWDADWLLRKSSGLSCQGHQEALSLSLPLLLPPPSRSVSLCNPTVRTCVLSAEPCGLSSCPAGSHTDAAARAAGSTSRSSCRADLGLAPRRTSAHWLFPALTSVCGGRGGQMERGHGAALQPTVPVRGPCTGSLAIPREGWLSSSDRPSVHVLRCLSPRLDLAPVFLTVFKHCSLFLMPKSVALCLCFPVLLVHGWKHRLSTNYFPTFHLVTRANEAST